MEIVSCEVYEAGRFIKPDKNRISKKNRMEKIIIMERTQKQIKQQTEEWLDERWLIANMKDSRPQDMSYYMGGLKVLEFAGYDWKRDSNGKHTLYK